MELKTKRSLFPASVPAGALMQGAPSSLVRNLFALAMLLGIGTLSQAQSPDRSPTWVEQRVQEMQPKPVERRLDEIGWAKNIRVALDLAKKHHRPVFLFTHDGRINTGRC